MVSLSIEEIYEKLENDPKLLADYAKNSLVFFEMSFRSNYTLPKHQVRWMLSLEDPPWFEIVGHLGSQVKLDTSKVLWKRKLILAPRDHGKTRIFTISFPLWSLLKNPNLKVLIISKTKDQATKAAMVIREELERNEQIIRCFGNLTTPRWAASQFYIKRSRLDKDPSVEAVGVLGAITGSHPDIIIIDDILDDINSISPYQRDIILQYFQGTLLQLAEPHTKIIVVGTRKHYQDLYSVLIESGLWQREYATEKAIIRWPLNYEYVRDAITGQIIDVEVEGDYQVLWPEKWDIKALLLDLASTGRLLFNREKQNDPSGMRGLRFQDLWLQYYNAEMLDVFDRDAYDFYQGYDLAIGEEEKAAYFSCVTVAVEKNKISPNIYIVDVYLDHLDFPAQVRKVISLSNMFKPDGIGIESIYYQRALPQILKALPETAELPIVQVTSTKNKIDRITADLSPLFEAGKIFLNVQGRGIVDFKKHYLNFPTDVLDDLDALDIALRIIPGDIFSSLIRLNIQPVLLGQSEFAKEMEQLRL